MLIYGYILQELLILVNISCQKIERAYTCHLIIGDNFDTGMQKTLAFLNHVMCTSVHIFYILVYKYN